MRRRDWVSASSVEPSARASPRGRANRSPRTQPTSAQNLCTATRTNTQTRNSPGDRKHIGSRRRQFSGESALGCREAIGPKVNPEIERGSRTPRSTVPLARSRGAVWLARRPVKAEAAGSTPVGTAVTDGVYQRRASGVVCGLGCGHSRYRSAFSALTRPEAAARARSRAALR